MKTRFSLEPQPRGTILRIREQQLGVPLTVNLPVSGMRQLVEKGAEVVQGEEIAKASAGSWKPSVHSSVCGKVTSATKDFITIEQTGTSLCEQTDFNSLENKDLLPVLRSMGINTSGLREGCSLIINAVPNEPGMDGHAYLIEEFPDIMEIGLEVLQRAIRPIAKAVAVPEKSSWTLKGCTGHEIKPIYPNGLAPMVVKKITGREYPKDVCVIDAATLYRIGRTVAGGRPVSDIMVKVGNMLFQAPVGTMTGMLAEKAGFSLSEYDRLVIGGPFSGTAVYTPNYGIPANAQMVSILPASAQPVAEDNPCLGCGECVIRCPARIMPNMISRHAEFGFYENTLEYFIGSCLECGLCGYWCPAHRPLLQYIRLAKRELSKQPILEDLRK